MSAGYRGVGWSRHKVVYDAVVAGAVVAFVGVFLAVSAVAGADAAGPEVLLLRATGAAAITLLHVVLLIGPACRFLPRLTPTLSNRRHLGVVTFLVALVHGVLAIGYYHGFGVLNPLRSLLLSNTAYGSLRGFPFEVLGVLALGVLFVLAATSHDFWLKLLTPRVWKRLHMTVYAAYALLVGHVVLGALQGRGGVVTPGLVGLGLAAVAGAHAAAGWRERRMERPAPAATADGSWIDAGEVDAIPMDRAKVVRAAGGERIAVFRHAGGVSAVTNVCAHQAGPLGEGRVIDGCITCPWHGWQYRPGDGCAPPPFTERIRTYPVRISAGRVQVGTQALPPGTAAPPARGEGAS